MALAYHEGVDWQENYISCLSGLAEIYRNEDDLENCVACLEKLYALTSDEILMYQIEAMKNGGYFETPDGTVYDTDGNVVKILTPTSEQQAFLDEVYWLIANKEFEAVSNLIMQAPAQTKEIWHQDGELYFYNGEHLSSRIDGEGMLVKTVSSSYRPQHADASEPDEDYMAFAGTFQNGKLTENVVAYEYSKIYSGFDGMFEIKYDYAYGDWDENGKFTGEGTIGYRYIQVKNTYLKNFERWEKGTYLANLPNGEITKYSHVLGGPGRQDGICQYSALCEAGKVVLDDRWTYNEGSKDYEQSIPCGDSILNVTPVEFEHELSSFFFNVLRDYYKK